MSSSALSSLVELATVDDIIDLSVICNALSITISLDKTMDDLCKTSRLSGGCIEVRIKASLEKKVQFTLAILAVSEFILQPTRILGAGLIYDMFYLKEMPRNAHSRSFMLATRLAIPEHIVEKLAIASENEFSFRKNENTDPDFNASEYVNNSVYMPEFMNMVIKESTARLLLDNITVKVELMKM